VQGPRRRHESELRTLIATVRAAVAAAGAFDLELGEARPYSALAQPCPKLLG
jgi:hypothetical protein